MNLVKFQELCKACDFIYFLSLDEPPSLREHFSSYEITIHHCRKRKMFLVNIPKRSYSPGKTVSWNLFLAIQEHTDQCYDLAVSGAKGSCMRSLG